MNRFYDVPAPKVQSALAELKESIKHFILLDFNYPREAMICIPQLHTAYELLLREYYKDKPKDFFNKKPDEDVNMKALIQAYDLERNYSDRHWLRLKRNDLSHTGEPELGSKNQVINHLRRDYEIVGALYQKLGYQLSNQFFTYYERTILSGKEPDWDDKAIIIAQAALNYYFDGDPETAVQMANYALELAFRGYARCWRVEDADTKTFDDIIFDLNDWEYHPGLPYAPEELKYGNRAAYYAINNKRGEAECPIFRIMDIAEIDESYEYNQDIQYYLEEAQYAVNCYVKKAPYLDFYECLLENWDSIMDDLYKKYPGMEIPKIDESLGIAGFWEDENIICIHIDQPLSKFKFEGSELKESIITKCGNVPKYQKISIEGPFDFVMMRSDEIDL